MPENAVPYAPHDLPRPEKGGMRAFLDAPLSRIIDALQALANNEGPIATTAAKTLVVRAWGTRRLAAVEQGNIRVARGGHRSELTGNAGGGRPMAKDKVSWTTRRRQLVGFWHQAKFFLLGAVLLTAGFVVAYQFVAPAPPSRVVIASGPATGAYNAFAKRYAALVKRDTLVDVAREIGLEAHLRLAKGDERAEDRDAPTILADGCEAVIAALYLDGGFKAAAQFVEKVWDKRLLADVKPPQDSKTALQEWAQGRKDEKAAPVYRVVRR